MRAIDLFAGAGQVKVLVPVSGGKDSEACLRLALQSHPASAVRGLFCDTKFEHPITYEHVEGMKTRYGVRIDTVNAGSVEEQCLKHKRFPSFAARFCTEELKIRPTKRYCKALAIEQGGFEVWYGMRSQESAQRKTRYAGKVCDELYDPHDVMTKYPKYLGKLGVMFRLAVLHWSEADVLDFLDGDQNPLYSMRGEDGNLLFDRVGCFPCLASGDKAKEAAFRFDETGVFHQAKVIRISAQIGKSVWTSKGGIERNDACALCTI